jgi:hypothetical protein
MTISTSSDGELDKPWFEAWVPHYISAGETFRVIVDDELGRFSMQIPCPIGAGGVSKILFNCSDGHTRIWCSDDETSTSDSYYSSNSVVNESMMDKPVSKTYTLSYSPRMLMLTLRFSLKWIFHISQITHVLALLIDTFHILYPFDC